METVEIFGSGALIMKYFRTPFLAFFLSLVFLAPAYAAADLCTSAVISQTDASNGSGTMPSWSGSAAPSTIDDAGRALQGPIAQLWRLGLMLRISVIM